MQATLTAWDRESIESLRGWNRPRVRIRVTYREGGISKTVDKLGEIVPDGNNPWIVSRESHGCDIAFRCSWGLVLEVLNDKHASPICFDDNRESK